MTTGGGDLNYACEKLGLAVDIMATTHGTLQERLLDAWRSQGHHAIPMDGEQHGPDMSEELAEHLREFDERMSNRPDVENVGTFEATILAFDDEDASDAARELTELSHAAHLEREEARRR